MIVFILAAALQLPSLSKNDCDQSAFIDRQKTERAATLTQLEGHLSKIEGILTRRNAIRQRLVELDAMSPAKRRLKSSFNSDYDYRVLEGRDQRLGLQIDGLKGSMAMLELRNKLLDTQIDEFVNRCAPKASDAPD